MAFNFDSIADASGYRTRLNIEPANATITSIQLLNGSNVVFEFPTLPTPFCTVQFTKYDLVTNELKKRDAQGNYTIQDFVNYTPVTPTSVSGDTIRYNNVQPAAYLGTGTAPTTFSPINLSVFFLRPNQTAEDQGWIDLDVAFTFPPELSDPAYTDKYAWQMTLWFPGMNFDVSAKADNTLIRDWSVLFPGGDLGKIRDFKSSPIPGMPVQFVHGMLVQYAALYKTDASYTRGIAFSATDTLGHNKAFIYGHPAATTVDSLTCHSVFPMHLTADKRYVRPSIPDDPSLNFRLIKGDKYGFGGARMVFRMKAFHINKETPGAALDWMDVANIYRKWVKSNRSFWFNKEFNRDKTGPLDNMSPHTVITNYGIDGPIDPAVSDPKLPSKWLEIHPIKVDGTTDMPANDNESLQDMLKRMRTKINSPDNAVRLEAQVWGYELGGYYHYIGGYPTVTSVLHPPATVDRFKKAMDELASAGIYPMFTTDLLRQLFNGGRYRGHVRWTSTDWTKVNDVNTWEEAIQHPFPSAYTDAVRNPNPCKFVNKTRYYPDPTNPNVYQDLDRVFIVKKIVFVVNNQELNCFNPQPNCPEAEMLAASQVYGDVGPAIFIPVLGNPFYNRLGRPICPTETVVSYYLNTQLSGGALKHGARLLEFMKTGYAGCFNKDHKHIFEDLSSYSYKNVIGLGAYSIERLRQVMKEIHIRARVGNPAFALTHEGAPPEPLLPLLNEYYHSAPVYNFIYSEAISAKMTLTEVDTYIHPGYKERRKSGTGTGIPLPDVLEASFEDAPKPPDLVIPPDPATMPEPNPARTSSFVGWRARCTNYFNQYFEVTNYGNAPRSYPVGPAEPDPINGLVPWNSGMPYGPTNPPTYTYLRCVQDVFNLRYGIYLTGAKAVAGERVFLQPNWFEPPFDYNDEIVQTATRAAHLQMLFAQFFRGGHMLGRATITGGNKQLWMWKADRRTFDDVKPLTNKAPGTGLKDFISRGYDKEYVDKFRIHSNVLTYDKIQHMIWRTGEGDARRILYVFANVGNADANVRYFYSRGLEGLPSDQTKPSGWERASTLIKDTGTVQATGALWLNMEEKFLNMPPRSFAAIEIRKINHAQFVAQSVPARMTAGQQYPVTVQMKNLGSSTWTDSAHYTLGSENPHDNRNWGMNRVAFGTGQTPPGQIKVFQFIVKAPAIAGTYNFQWRMLQLQVEWFGDLTPNVAVTVVP